MSGPAWPAVVDALLAAIPAIPAFSLFEVYDGQPVSNSAAASWVSVGWPGADMAGQYAQGTNASGFGTDEAGEVAVLVAVTAGDTEQSVTRTGAFAAAAALQSWIESHQTLGGLLTAGAVVSTSTQIVGMQNQQGSATQLLIAVHYQTVTYYPPN
jgi:hypothetical protein